MPHPIDTEVPMRTSHATITEIEYKRPGRQTVTVTENRSFNDGTIHRIELTRRSERYSAEIHTTEPTNSNLLHRGSLGRISRLCVADRTGVIADYDGTHGLLSGWIKKPRTAAGREIVELLNDLSN